MIVAALAAARLARLVAEDEITVGFRRWVVNHWGPNSWLTKLIHCAPWCMSMWFGFLSPAVVFWHNQWVLAALTPFATSMVAAIILRTADRE